MELDRSFTKLLQIDHTVVVISWKGAEVGADVMINEVLEHISAMWIWVAAWNLKLSVSVEYFGRFIQVMFMNLVDKYSGIVHFESDTTIQHYLCCFLVVLITMGGITNIVAYEPTEVSDKILTYDTGIH